MGNDLSCPFAPATGALCCLDPFEEREKAILPFLHEAQRKVSFRVNICMHIGCELFTKQAGHNGFQFLLTATCIDCLESLK